MQGAYFVVMNELGYPKLAESGLFGVLFFSLIIHFFGKIQLSEKEYGAQNYELIFDGNNLKLTAPINYPWQDLLVPVKDIKSVKFRGDSLRIYYEGGCSKITMMMLGDFDLIMGEEDKTIGSINGKIRKFKKLKKVLKPIG